MVGRDYVSGAMENTTATLHGAGAYKSNRELADANAWETTVAHELFHQWFGDYVTTESWSNITVNESFADFSELLWEEHKYGKDFGDAENYTKQQNYLQSRNSTDKNLVRFQYADKEEVFDAVSYTKGGRILNMLRHYLGDTVFFKGLNTYLTTNKFKNGEAQQLRLALEEASGKDLNWFFNEWYYGAGNPDVTIAYDRAEEAGKEKITITQKQAGQLFQFPVSIDVYNGDRKSRQDFWVRDSVNVFNVSTNGGEPTWINVDGDKTMLWRKDDRKPAAWFVQQYNGSSLYVDKVEALTYLAANFDSSNAQRAVFANALSDRYHGIRQLALNFYSRHTDLMTPAEAALVYSTAQNFYHNPTRALAIDLLAKKGNKTYTEFYKKAVFDSSYSVAGAALEALFNSDMAVAQSLQPTLSKDARGRLQSSLTIIDYAKKTNADADSVIAAYKRLSVFERINMVKPLMYYLVNVTDLKAFKQVVAPVLESTGRAGAFGGGRLGGLRNLINDNINWLLQKKEAALAADPNNKDLQEQIKYVHDKQAAGA